MQRLRLLERQNAHLRHEAGRYCWLDLEHTGQGRGAFSQGDNVLATGGLLWWPAFWQERENPVLATGGLLWWPAFWQSEKILAFPCSITWPWMPYGNLHSYTGEKILAISCSIIWLRVPFYDELHLYNFLA